MKKYHFTDDVKEGHEQNSICHIAARHGSIKVLKAFGRKLVGRHFRNNVNDTWLHEAARWGQIEAARYIIGHFRRHVMQNVWNKNEENVIDVAISTACFQFITSLDYEFVRKIVKKDFGKTILHVIAANGLNELLDAFSIADMQKQDGFQDTPLHTAAKSKHYVTLNKMLSKLSKPQQSRLINVQNEDMETILHIAGKQGRPNVVEGLIKLGADIQIQNFVGNTPLHELLSSDNVNEEMLSMLMGKLVDTAEDPFKNALHMKNKEGRKLLHIAGQKSFLRLVKELVENDAALAEKDDPGTSLLFDLLSSNAVQDERILDLVCDLEEECLRKVVSKYTGESLLHLVATSGLTKLVSRFSFVGLDKQDKSSQDTALHVAAKNKHFDTLKELVDCYTKHPKFDDKWLVQVLGMRNNLGEAVLHVAAKQADIPMTEYLIEKGADISMKDYTSSTALHYLVSSSEIKADQSVEFIKKIADSQLKTLQHEKNQDGETVLQIASRQTKVEVVDYLMDVDRETLVGGQHSFPIFEMLSSTDINSHKTVAYILNLEDKILQEVVRNEPVRDKKTVLHIIAIRGLTPLVRKFSFIDYSQKDAVDDTALHTAARYKNFQTLRELINCYKDRPEFEKLKFMELLELRNEEGETVLHIACRLGNIDLVTYLLEEGADLSIDDENDSTPLHHLISSAEIQAEKSVDFINSLKDDVVQKAVDIDTKRKKDKYTDNKFETIMHMIAASGLKTLVRKFSFIDFKQKDKFEDSVLHTAARHRHFPTLRELVAIISDKPNFNDSVLEELLNLRNDEGETVLHLATKFTSLEIVEYLIKHGANLAAQDNTGNTPLHDLIDKAASDVAHMDDYISVWHVFVQNVVFWWCSEFNLTRPYKSSEDYSIYQRDAVYYLRSEVPNKQKLSVIQLAATRGLVDFVKEMIWVEGVFVKQVNSDKSQEGQELSEEQQKVEINVTNLMPDLGGGNDVNYKRKNNKYSPMSEFRIDDRSNGRVPDITFDEIKDVHREDIRDCCCSCNNNDDGFSADRCLQCGLRACCLPCFISFLFSDNLKLKKQHSLMDAILKVKQGNKANEIFEVEPMKQLVRDYWFVHQWWTVVMLVIHLVYMTIYSTSSLDKVRIAFTNNATFTNSNEAIFIVWPVTLVIPDIIIMLGLPIRYLVSNRGTNKYLKERVIGSTNIDVKDIFNWPSVLLAFVVALIPFLLPMAFCLSTILAIALTGYNDTYFSDMTTIS